LKQILNISKYSGGQSGNEKEGIANSFKYVKNLNVRDNPTLLKVQPRTSKDSGTTVTDLILDAVRVKNGDTYFIGDTGNFYKRTAAGVWSLIGDAGDSSGGSLIYREDTDYIYIPLLTTIATYGPLSGTPALTASAIATSLDQKSYNGAATYALTTGVNEGYTHVFDFQPEAEPFYSVKLKVVAKGTGNWTVTLHDDANNVLGTSTVANASLTNGILNEFVFTPVRMLVKPNARTYHFHITSTVADGTIQTKTDSKGAITVTIASPAVFTLSNHGLSAGDQVYLTTTGALPTGLSVSTPYYVITQGLTASTFQVSTVAGGAVVNTSGSQSGTHTLYADFAFDHETYATRFISTRNGLHPAVQFLQYNCFGNGNYLSVWEPLTTTPTSTEFNRHRLTFPSGYEVCGVAYSDEFMAIACEKRSTDDDSDFQDGKIFFWDGMAGTYNFFIDVPEGAPYSPFYYKGILYYMARGERFAYAGGLPTKIQRFPNVEQEYTSERDYVRLYPNMATVRKGVLLQGFPSDTANTTLEYGVYGLGSRDKEYPASFSYDFQISTGTILNTAGTLKIGMVKNFNEDLFISWKDDAAYGVDRVYNNSLPARTAEIETLIFDNSNPWGDKMAIGLKSVFKALPTGCTVMLKYKIDREASWHTSDTAVAGDTELVYKFATGRRFKEIEFGLSIATAVDSTATPEIISLAFEFDDLREETGL
jgi:hypothetical protein